MNQEKQRRLLTQPFLRQMVEEIEGRLAKEEKDGSYWVGGLFVDYSVHPFIVWMLHQWGVFLEGRRLAHASESLRSRLQERLLLVGRQLQGHALIYRVDREALRRLKRTGKSPLPMKIIAQRLRDQVVVWDKRWWVSWKADVLLVDRTKELRLIIGEIPYNKKAHKALRQGLQARAKADSTATERVIYEVNQKKLERISA